jgi:hypothetical protein
LVHHKSHVDWSDIEPMKKGAGKAKHSKGAVIVLWRREEGITWKVPRFRPLVLLVLWKW